MVKKIQEPAIRFQGFSTPWEQRKFSEITSVASFKPYLSDASCSGKFEVIQQGDNPVLGYADGEPYMDYEKIVLFGDHTLSLFKPKSPFFVASDGLKILFSDEMNGSFYYHLLEKYKPESEGYKRHFSILKESECSFPKSAEEQNSLGTFFDSLDNLITLHQRKYEKLANIKKSMLGKMFPRDGAKVPEIRFAGFTDPWEQRKVKELCSIATGKSNTQDKVDDGNYPFYVRSPIIERSAKYLYDEEAVLTVGDGVGTGKVFHYVNGKYDLHQRCYRMYSFTEELNAKYFYHIFSLLFYARVMAMTAKTSVDSVRMEMIADMEVPVPNIGEQKKIAAYFADLDTLITLHQRKYEKLINIKKSMLEGMFV